MGFLVRRIFKIQRGGLDTARHVVVVTTEAVLESRGSTGHDGSDHPILDLPDAVLKLEEIK